ncbi:MAG: thermonuclease family protein [Candidatus Hydrogenedentes bacterium]|nr:thermonuclease family protein [Candidatus Hydrogenedentota bacterium]
MRIVSSILSILMLALPAGIAPGETEEFTGKVVAVSAGDLVSIEHDGRTEEVRLYAVDCPESGQLFADDAKSLCTDLALAKDVKVQVVTQDNQGKSVAWVLLPDGKNLNLALVEAGLAWWDQEHAKDSSDLKRVNAEAIEAKKGLWSEETPLAPWDFRASRGIEPITYKTDVEKPLPAPPEEEVKSVSAKGNGEYTGVFNIAAPQIQEMEQLDPTALLLQHPPQPVKDASGKITGWTAPNISQIPFATQLGFQDGDVITSVNGIPVGDMATMMQMAPQFQGVKQFRVDVQRGGQTVPITINLP